MMNPLFLIGAGFNADAHNTVINLAVPCYYPLANDLPKICFEKDKIDPDTSIEQLLEEEISNKNLEPIRKLYDSLMQADYFIGGTIVERLNSDSNIYKKFLERFNTSQFLTFNYDSLLEIILFKLNRWRPEDGFGLPVNATQRSLVNPISLPDKSQNVVLHLHGSLCVFSSEFDMVGTPVDSCAMLKPRDKSIFIFDADKICSLFFPYERILHSFDYERIEHRVIAPVPDKADGLNEDFIKTTYKRAIELIDKSNVIISIGYSFNPVDHASYVHLIERIEKKNCELYIVAPEAKEIRDRLCGKFKKLIVKAMPLTFGEWASNAFALNYV